MTVPTRLTVARFLLAFVVMALVFVPGWIAKASALAGFLLAGLTDWLDGYLARRWQQTSPFGALLDPIADKVLVLGIFLVFVQLRLVPAWMVLVILLRELVITSVRLYAASRNVVIAAAREGKNKTASQMLAILLVLVLLLMRELLEGRQPAFEEWMARLVLASMWVTVLLTMVSGATFFWRNRALLTDAVAR